ncbi:ABC transporter substrate-binding protein [Pseudorhodobacter sp. W20_MBD10_FR17]|uniref:ABC transporter substrate-binding protein n=1 Tax=Pseudorhodobacter sp. W20_MBD10_FR17 TaxID=3240266 RepID=UPI003F998453
MINKNGLWQPTRRDFGKSLLAASSLAAAYGFGLGTAQAATPKRGGHLRIASYASSANDSMDPAKAVFANDYFRCFTFYNALTRPDVSVQAQPDLAESWEAFDGAKRWVFKIRTGVQFHNGKTLSAHDVVYSMNRHKIPETGSAAKAIADTFASVVALDDQTIEFVLSTGNADLPLVLATAHFVIVADGASDFSAGGFGTGPYKLTEFRPGIKTLAERNDNYHRPGAHVDSIELFGITDSIARTNALVSGQADIILKAEKNTLDLINSTPTTEVFRTPSSGFPCISMTVDMAPFDNNDLRLAMKYMIDRERLLKTSFNGFGVLGNDHIFHPDSIYYNADIPQREMDLDKAKFHLNKAGMVGQTIDMHVSEASVGGIDIGLTMQQAAAKSGLNLNLRREPADGFWSNIWAKRSFYAAEWNPRPVYDMILSLAFMPGAAWNETHINDPKLASLIEQARGETDQALRKELYGEVQLITNESGGYGIPLFFDFVDAKTTAVQGIEPIPLGYIGGLYFAESVWLDQ